MAKKLLFNNVNTSGGGDDDNKIYLYKRGDLCTSVTGGWTLNGNTTFESDHIKMTHASGNYMEAVNKLTFTKGNKTHVIMMVDNPPNEGSYYLGLKSGIYWMNKITTNTIKTTYGYNVVFDFVTTATSNEANIVFSIAGYYSNFNIYEIYIEKVS